MKKSQILAALALAFALGVVAPVAGVANNASAFTVADVATNTKGSATVAEVNNAIAAVKANYPAYESMIALNNLLTGKNAITAADDITATSGVANVASNIVTKLTTDFSFRNTDEAITNVKDAEKYTDQISNAISAATSVKNYGTFAKIVNGIANKDNVMLRSGIQEFNNIFGTQLSYNSDVNYDNFQTSTLVTTAGTPTYAKFEKLINNVNIAQKAANTYTTNFQNLQNALLANGVLNNTGRDALAVYTNGEGKVNPRIANLLSLANNPTCTNNRTAWAGVKNAVDAASNAQDYSTEYNYNRVIAIAQALQTAVPVLDKTATEIAEQLVISTDPGTNQPTNPDQPTNPENPDDNKPTTPTTPPTGVVDSSDNNASTTVSIIAGLATALTAAGAGIVAYRNARRSSDKEA